MTERLPSWFSQKPPDPQAVLNIDQLLQGLHLKTICHNAHCPNLGTCFSRGTATFLILGEVCTRNCTFCAVKKGTPQPLDLSEPEHLLEAVEKLALQYVVITSVTRDDLADGGASYFTWTIKLLHQQVNGLRVEVLVPDFGGSSEALQTVVDAHPDVLNHNVETVPRLYPEVRPMADYERSVRILSEVKRVNPGIVTKSGLMLGLGETEEEVIEVMHDLREADCDLLTIGQYLRPSAGHHPAVRFIPPPEFAEYARLGKSLGFIEVASAPLVRSSFEAAAMYARLKENQE